jgi:hypothetical protein
MAQWGAWHPFSVEFCFHGQLSLFTNDVPLQQLRRFEVGVTVKRRLSRHVSFLV